MLSHAGCSNSNERAKEPLLEEAVLAVMGLPVAWSFHCPVVKCQSDAPQAAPAPGAHAVSTGGHQNGRLPSVNSHPRNVKGVHPGVICSSLGCSFQC